MFLGFSKTLKKMGGFRIHLGLNLKKWYTWFLLFFVGIFYAMYYLMLASLWMIYGIAWCFYKLGVWWIALFKMLKKGWQKGALIGGTAVLVLILAIVGGHAAKNQPVTMAENEASAAESVIAEKTIVQITETATTTTTTTTKPTTTTTTATTTTTTTTATTTTTTTTKPTTTTTTTRPTTERTTAPTVAYQTSSTYVLNTNTMRIHYPNCSSVGKILPENYAETDDYNAAIQEGYKPCGNCHPR